MSAVEISTFLESVRSRLNREVLLRVSAWALLSAAAACVLWALGWRVFGYAAPRSGYLVIVLAAAIATLVWIVLGRRQIRDAASSADRAFSLKDGLLSWLDFRAREEPVAAYELHEKSIAAKVGGLDVRALEISNPRRIFAGGGALTLLAIGLALLPHGAEVRKRLALEAITRERSAIVSKEMEKAVEELIHSLSKEERELLDENKLREWSKEIEQTKDARQAEKQLAKIEQQIAQTMQGLEARQDEAMLKLAAEELEKSSSADVRQLGKQLDAKDFEKAADQLDAMKPGAKEKMSPEELQKLKENAAKSKDMAKRMSDGAKKRDFGKTGKNDGKSGAMKPSSGEQKPMQEMLDDLDQDSRSLDKELSEDDDYDKDDQELADAVDGDMDQLGKRLGKLSARAKAKGKLSSLRQSLAQARQFSQGRSQTLGLAQNPGGKPPGVGSVESRRNERDELKDNGNRAEVKGQDNPDGPSKKTVESAESGTGVAGRANVARDREFKQQYESLVHRDDIPESLKLGIREYFEKVHETEPENK